MFWVFFIYASFYSKMIKRKGDDRKGRGGRGDWFKVYNNQLQCMDLKWIMFYSNKLWNMLWESQGNMNTDRILMISISYYYFLNHDNGNVVMFSGGVLSFRSTHRNIYKLNCIMSVICFEIILGCSEWV